MALYDGFISYSHAKDKPVAASLQSAIQKLGKPWYRRRALRLFRDDTSLSATPHLWPTIEKALSQSRFFVLLASPEAAASRWVNKEVTRWIENNPIDGLLIGLTAGDLVWDDGVGDFTSRETVPLPPALARRFPTEPKWVDLRPYREGAEHAAASRRDAKFTDRAADFAAAIHGKPKEDLLSQEVRQQRRALALAWSSAASLLVLAGLAGWQWSEATSNARLATAQKLIAEQQRDRAEKTLVAATKTANDLVFNLAREFRNRTGMPTELVRDILGRAVHLQQDLAQSGEAAPSLRRSEAAALMEAVDTLVAQGETGNALATGARAYQIMSDITSSDPTNQEWQRDLCVASAKLGQIAFARGELSEAMKFFSRSFEVLERLLQSNPANLLLAGDLADVLGGIADVLAAQGKLPEAIKTLGSVLALQDALATAKPAEVDWQRDPLLKIVRRNRIATFIKMGDFLAIQKDGQRALASFHDALEVAKGLAAAEPDNVMYRSDVSLCYERLGDWSLGAGNVVEALQFLHASHAIRERLAQDDPGNMESQRSLAFAEEKLGNALLAQGNLPKALEYYRTELLIRERLAKADPKNGNAQRDLAFSHMHAGVVLMREDLLADAVSSFRSAVAIRKSLSDSEPGNTNWQRELAWEEARLANALASQGNHDEALALLQQGYNLISKLKEKSPDNATVADDFTWFDRRLAEIKK